MSAPQLFQATGAEQSERAVSALVLSGAAGATPTPLRRRRNGAPVVSCEAWLRLRMSPATSPPMAISAWMPDLDPEIDWILRAGVSRSYRTPTTATSIVATVDMPTTEARSLPLPATQGESGWASDWLVLQAIWTPEPGSVNYELQPQPGHLHVYAMGI